MGRLGNQMFQISAAVGIAHKNSMSAIIPYWKYTAAFKNINHFETKFPDKIYKEPSFSFTPVKLTESTDLIGYFQSEKYFIEERKFIRNELFEFKAEFKKQCRAGLEEAFQKETIAIHIRRGDYVNNPHYKKLYYQLPITWFINALFSIKGWKEKNIIIFSDDIEYCKFHFNCLDNVYFSEGKTDVEDMCLGSQCDNHIISNSTFAWWMAYLSEQKNVIHSGQLFIGDFADKDISDFYPENWTKFWPEEINLDLTDTTFTIPVFADSKDRKQNLDLCVCILQNFFKTNIIVGEQGSNRFGYFSEWCKYMKFDYHRFHRTKMLNEMAKAANTPYLANWDCDVIIAPLQIYMAVESLRMGNDMVFPYDGRFARLPRVPWFKLIESNLDLSPLKDAPVKGKGGRKVPETSVGGAVFFNKEKFIEGGMENENMVSFGPEDCERNDRFTALGYKIDRTEGVLYHIDHWCGPDSSIRNPHFKRNHAELDKIRKMDKETLRQYIKTWPWASKQPIQTSEREYKIKAVINIDGKEKVLYDNEVSDCISMFYRANHISNSIKTVLHVKK
jgi:hypothetical protein